MNEAKRIRDTFLSMKSDTPSTETRKRGAPKGNRNHLRHGLRAGKLPLDCQHVEQACNLLRRQLEDAVIASKGEVSLTDAAAILTATKWERHSQLALRWLRVAEKLTPTEQLTFSREVARASTERDKAIERLRLDRDSRDTLFDSLYSRLALPAPTPTIKGGSDGDAS